MKSTKNEDVLRSQNGKGSIRCPSRIPISGPSTKAVDVHILCMMFLVRIQLRDLGWSQSSRKAVTEAIATPHVPRKVALLGAVGAREVERCALFKSDIDAAVFFEFPYPLILVVWLYFCVPKNETSY